MRIFKSTLGIILSLIVASSCAVVADAAGKTAKSSKSAVKKTITVTQHKTKEIKIKYDSACSVSVKATGNKKAVRIEYNGFQDGKKHYLITGKSVTGKKPATVKVVKENYKTGKKTTFRTYKVNVKAPEEKKFAAIKLSTGTNLLGSIKDRGFCSYYTLRIKDTDVVSLTKSAVKGIMNNDVCYTFDAHKQGETEADVCVKKVKVGTVKIKVGDYKPYLNLKDNILVLKYNKHGRAQNIYESDITASLRNYDYSYDDESFVTDGKYIEYKSGEDPSFITKKTGDTAITVLGGDKELATVNVKIVKGTMAEVYMNNLSGDGDSESLHYENIIGVSNGETTFDMFTPINNIVLNNESKGTKFSKKDYKITYSVKNTKYASVDKKGVVHLKKNAPKKGCVVVDYKISFSDKSTCTDSLGISLV